MSAIDVGTLRLRCPTSRQQPVQDRLIDAMRTSLPNDGRLVLVRKLSVAREATSTNHAERSGVLRRSWLEATTNARHGGASGASAANCVWFENADEAERLLLHHMLRGGDVSAWYWRLAVPHWQGEDAAKLAEICFTRALATDAIAQVIALVELLGDGLLPIALRMLAGTSTLTDWSAEKKISSMQSDGGWVDQRGEAPPPEPAPQLAAFEGYIPPTLTLLCRRLIAADASAGTAAVRRLMRALALVQTPALRLSSAALTARIDALTAWIETREAGARARAKRWGDGQATEPFARPSSSRRPPTPRGVEARSNPAVLHLPPDSSSHANRAGRDQSAAALASTISPPTASGLLPVGAHSLHAGLWLIIPTLIDLGFREWLAARPMLLGEDPGRALIRHIALRHRIAPDDAALIPLGEMASTCDDRLRCWHRAVDGYLRRHARLRVHDLCRTAGRIRSDETSIDIHYPPSAIRLGLRRHALDRDPGWTDWLGVSLRFHFATEEGGL